MKFNCFLFFTQFQYLTVLSVELHCQTRGDLRPDPEFDPIQAIFFSILNDIPPAEGRRDITGMIVVDGPSASARPSESASCHSNHSHRSSSPQPSTSKTTPRSKTTASPQPSTSKTTPRSKSSPKSVNIQCLMEKSGVRCDDVIYVGDEAALVEEFIAFVKRYLPPNLQYKMHQILKL